MALKRPPNTSGIFLGGVGGTVGKDGAGPSPEDVRKRFAKQREDAAKARLKAVKKESPGFFERLADDIGLDDFYERDVIPVMGKVFAETFKNAKETYGVSLVSPLVMTARVAAAVADKEEAIDEGFDYAAEAVRAGAGVIKTEGWEPAKKFVAPAVDKGTKIAKQSVDAFKDAVEKTDDYVEKEAPQYAMVKSWANRHAYEPAKDAAAEVISKVTDQPINRRIDSADEMDRQFLYQSNDIIERGKESESAATPQQRQRWIRMALGQYENPAWEGYTSPFSLDQLQAMSDYELVNAAYGTHTNSIAGLFEAAKNDFKKIAAMPAALNLLSEQITDADKRGDYRGLGNMAEFLGRQIASVFMAVNQATLYAATGGQLGDAEPLVRALKTEPILTSLDAAATLAIYGKGATVALKTGGAVSKAGAVAARVPGAPRVGGAIARGAEAAAAVPTVGAPLRAAAAAARGARRLADVERVEVRDPALRALAETQGVEIGADRVFRPSSSIFSKSAALLRKRIYEGENPISRAIYRRGEKADARAVRAISSAIVEQLGSEDAAPIVAAFTEIYKESPDLAMRVLWDTQGPSSFAMPEGMGGKVLDLTPGAYADELEDVLAGRLWLRRGSDPEADDNDVFRFSDQSPGEGWQRVSPYGSVRTPDEPITKLTKLETSNLKAQIKVLRRLDDLPEDVVVRAREVLQKPYNEVFGERIGRRIGGRAAPTESLENLLSVGELDRIRKITGLGVKVDSRVADLPSDITDRLRSQLGIGAPTGITRRAEGMAAAARLQDLTIARLMPLVPDEVRADVERILGEAEERIRGDIVKAQTKIEEQTVVSASERKKLADELAQAEAALASLEKYVNEKAKSVISQMTEQERNAFYDKERQAWIAISDELGLTQSGGDKTFFDSIPTESPNVEAYKYQSFFEDTSVVFGEKVDGPAGSNTAGVTGYWQGTDGVLRYVKQYSGENALMQTLSEFFANKLYDEMAVRVADARLVISPDSNQILIVSKVVPGETLKEFLAKDYPIEVKQGVAKEIIYGMAVDLWLANWDAIGLDFDNIIVHQIGPNIFAATRIDQGGALFTRAQGELKTPNQLSTADFKSFWDQNPSYKKILELAGYDSIDDFPMAEQGPIILGKVKTLLNDVAEGTGTSTVKDGLQKFIADKAGRIFLEAQDKATDSSYVTSVFLPIRNFIASDDFARLLATFLGNRYDAMIESAIRLVDNKNALGDVKPQNNQNQIGLVKRGIKVLMKYQQVYYDDINGFLRGKYSLETGSSQEKTLTKEIKELDALFDVAPATTEDIVVYRGRKGTSLNAAERDQLQETGYVDIDKGFVSTSLSPSTAKNFAKTDGILYEIAVPKGSKVLYGNAIHGNDISPHPHEQEILFPRGTGFKVIESGMDGNRIVLKVIAITPGSEDAAAFPEFGFLINKIREDQLAGARSTVQVKKKELGKVVTKKEAAASEKALEDMRREYETILDAQKNVDFVLESLMRDALEASDTPTGAMVFMPTLGGGKDAKKTVLPKAALAGRGRPRDLKDIYTGQFAMLGSLEDLEQFSGVLARNMRVPFVAYEIVTRLTDYLMRTGVTVRFSKDAAEFEKQIEELSEAGLINGNGELGTDYVILPVNDKTGFFDDKSFESVKTKELLEVGTGGRSDVGVDDAQLSVLIQKTLAQNAIDNLKSIPKGSTVVVLSKGRLDALQKELAAAAQAPGRLRQLTRLWVRITLTTLPRTPIANVVGSAFLSMLGNGLGGYREALRLLKFSNAPPELLNKGLAGMFDEGGDLVVSPERKRFRLAQRYMNYMYYYNVMGEDLARLSVFAQQAKKGIKKSGVADQIDAELLQATELNDAFQLLLEAVARGEFANGKPLTPELIRIRDDALQKADDFLGGARGLTSQQRMITTFIPFWQWYKHIFKLYFYTLPFKYPGRSLTLNAMARYGAEESARQGYYDSFYEDGIKIGEDVRGPNIYSKALSTNIFPFTFAGVLEAEEGAPGVSFFASNVAPVVTTPLRIAGFGVPGQPLITPQGEQLREGFFSGATSEVALSELERLIAPVGLLQRYFTPRGSLLLGAGRLATGREVPQAEPRGQGLQYAVTPRGFAGLGLQAAPELLARAFGGTIERIPIEGPVARRRLRDFEKRERQNVLEKYREERRREREDR